MKIVGGILGPEKLGGYELTGFPAIGPNFLDAQRRATPIGIIAKTAAQRSVPDGFLIFWYPEAMKITVELPEDLAQHADPGREALEALAIEGYRSSALSHYQASQLLGLSRFEFDGFLKQRRIYDHAYDLEDLDQDLKTLRQLEAKGLLPR